MPRKVDTLLYRPEVASFNAAASQDLRRWPATATHRCHATTTHLAPAALTEPQAPRLELPRYGTNDPSTSALTCTGHPRRVSSAAYLTRRHYGIIAFKQDSFENKFAYLNQF
jgi:hypothetical protein